MSANDLAVTLSRAELAELVEEAARKAVADLPEPSPFLNQRQAAELLGVSPSAISHATKDRGCPGFTVPGIGWRCRRDKLIEWMNAQLVKGAA